MEMYFALISRLKENGMSEEQARAVMARAMEHESFSNMKDRWTHDVSAYPDGFTNILFGLLRPIAFEWLTENAPKAWFRVVFAPGIEGLQGEAQKDFIRKFQKEQQQY